MEAVTSDVAMMPDGMSFESAIEVAKTKEELGKIAETLGLMIDGRMSLENAKKGLIETHRAIVKQAKERTEQSVKKVAKQGDPIVKIRFSVLDILNPEESPLFEFSNDCGKKVEAGETIPRWSFMHGQEYSVPYSLYEFLNTLTIPRSKWIEDLASPGGKRCITYQQKRFNCELVGITKEQIMQLQNA